MNCMKNACSRKKNWIFESVTTGRYDSVKDGHYMKIIKKFAGPLAILIKINRKNSDFHDYPSNGTGAFHELWLERNANMVYMRVNVYNLRSILLETGEKLERS